MMVARITIGKAITTTIVPAVTMVFIADDRKIGR